ncbi:MAG: sigma 54-interacting transcriptional regulator, partial [Bacillota bacterium]
MQLQAVFDSVYDALFVTAPSGVILQASKSCMRLFGVPAEAWVGRNWDWVEANVTAYPSVTRMALLEKKPLTAEQVTKTGKRLLISANPVTDRDGNVVILVTTARDVSELVTLRNQVKRGISLTGSYHTHVVALTTRVGFPSIIAASQAMHNVLDQVEKVAPANCTVLLLGESGVGKELIARAIHQHSSCKDGPFVKINCGSIPDTLVESELFGYVRGAFTGANSEGKPGLFQMAKHGTIFLDEVGELPEPVQPKMLQVLEDGQYLPVGGVQPRKAECRIIAATNANLEEMVRNGRFRADLYYRLAVVVIRIPPLRERTADVEPLALHFLESLNRKYGKNLRLSPEALDLMAKYEWPGNVRELKNFIERIVISMEDNELVTPERLRLPHHIVEGSNRSGSLPAVPNVPNVPQDNLTLKAANRP